MDAISKMMAEKAIARGDAIKQLIAKRDAANSWANYLGRFDGRDYLIATMQNHYDYAEGLGYVREGV